MAAAVELKNIGFKYPGKQMVLKDISLTIPKGQTAIIAGLSGCGKTTLCHIICGVIPHAVEGELEGEALVLGCKCGSLAEAALYAGLVFQDSDAQIIGTTVEDELAFGLENINTDPREIRLRVDEMAARLGFSHMLERDPATLSGGEKRLLTLGGVLLLGPEIVVLDEPMNSLDEDGRRLMREAIDGLKRQGKTIILVEHDLKHVTYADRWIIISEGGIALDGSPAELTAEPDRLKALELYFD